MIIRLDKYLADLGFGTRKEVKKLIRKSKAFYINGKLVLDDDYKVDTENDEVYYGDELLTYEEMLYFMLNKPQGYVSATEDYNLPTVIDLIDVPNRRKLFPVGRLDIDTTGLLIITNDGKLAHENLSPKHHVYKEYRAVYSGVLAPDTKDRFEKGIEIEEGFITKPATIEILENNVAIVRICEGKFHQVKRMIAACGAEVIELERIKFGEIELDRSLDLGEYRPLTEEELQKLKKD